MKLSAKKIILIAGLLFVATSFLLTADHFGFLNKPNGWFHLIMEPWQKAASFSSQEISSFFGNAFTLRQIVQDNYMLKAENLDLISRLNDYENLKQENEFLRQALAFEESSKTNLVVARIIGQNVIGDRQLIILDKGKKSGISHGLVIVPPDILIGRIVESTDNSSFFLPVISPQSQVQASITRLNASGLIKGRDSSLLVMDMIPQDKDIQIDDLVVGGQLDGRNLNLPLGKVVKIVRSDLGVFQQALVRPLVDINSISLVAVLVSGQD